MANYSYIVQQSRANTSYLNDRLYRTIYCHKKESSFINITLEEDIAQLDEVVVVGYGTQKKVSLTGSISNVGTEDLKSMPVSSVTNALGGRIPD